MREDLVKWSQEGVRRRRLRLDAWDGRRTRLCKSLLDACYPRFLSHPERIVKISLVEQRRFSRFLSCRLHLRGSFNARIA